MGERGTSLFPFTLDPTRAGVLLGCQHQYLVVGANITMTSHCRGGRLAKGQV